MNRDRFLEIIGRMSDQFGEKHFSGGKADRIWDSVRYLTDREFESCMETLCDSARFAPTVADIRQACVIPLAKAKDRHRQSQLENLAERCEFCDNTGHLFAFKRVQPELEYQFRCFCNAGNIVKSSLPEWDSKIYGKEFSRLPLTAKALTEWERRASASRGVPHTDEKNIDEWMQLANTFLNARKESR